MSGHKKTVFITGATGKMGQETLKQFVQRRDRFRLKLLVFDSPRDRHIIAPYACRNNIDVVYGNMKDARLIEHCVRDADYVLHIGAMVSPMADRYPEETVRVNLGSTLHILDAIKRQPNRDDIALVYIGTVGQTGCRRDPIHWGRIGDPIKGSLFDYYSTSKIAAERAVFESGLKKWVSIRQTGMLPFVSAPSPIMFHQNLNNVLEWITAEESGLLMANLCEGEIPASFWRRAYNVGGGEKWRFTLWQLLELYFGMMGLDYTKFLDPRDMGIYNFHGQWYTDSDELNAIANFRILEPETFFRKELQAIRTIRSIPLLRRLLPNEKRMRRILNQPNTEPGGTVWMFEHDMEAWITAFFGSREARKQIKNWDGGYEIYDPSRSPTLLDHGYDESKPSALLDLGDIQGAAAFRGGTCLSSSMTPGDLYTPLTWACHLGHRFTATPNLILKGGHWCPECERSAWDYAAYADYSPFHAQVWKPLHGDDHRIRVEKEFSDRTVRTVL